MPRFKRKGKLHVSKAVKKYVHNATLKAQETKNVNQPISLIGTIADSGTIFQSCPIAQGTNLFERVGEVIKPVKYQVRLFVNAQTAVTTATPVCMRAVLICQRQNSAIAVPAVVDVLTQATPANPLAPLSNYNNVSLSNKDFTVIYDGLWTFDLGKGYTRTIEFTKFGKSLPSAIHYQGTLSTDVGKNTMYWVFCSNIPTAGIEPAVTGYEQLWYKDG